MSILSNINTDYLISTLQSSHGQNLIPYPYKDTTKTENGIQFTDNGDGTITVNGTATDNAIFLLSTFSVFPGTYTISGLPQMNNNNSKIAIHLAKGNDYTMSCGTYGDNVKTITYSQTITFTYCRIVCYKGSTLENAVFKPQLERGFISHDYIPYSETHYIDTALIDKNKELESQIKSMQADITALKTAISNTN